MQHPVPKDLRRQLGLPYLVVLKSSPTGAVRRYAEYVEAHEELWSEEFTRYCPTAYSAVTKVECWYMATGQLARAWLLLATCCAALAVCLFQSDPATKLFGRLLGS